MKYQLTIEDSELKIIGDALNVQPHQMVRGLIDKIQVQVNAQETDLVEKRKAKAQEDFEAAVKAAAAKASAKASKTSTKAQNLKGT